MQHLSALTILHTNIIHVTPALRQIVGVKQSGASLHPVQGKQAPTTNVHAYSLRIEP